MNAATTTEMTVNEITINTFHMAAKSLKWLGKVVNMDDPRTCLGAVHIREGFAFASDGHRFHLVVNDSFGGKWLSVGDYEIRRINKKEITLRENSNRKWSERYRFEAIFPDCSDYRCLELEISKDLTSGYAFTRFVRESSAFFDYEYFQDLFPNPENRRCSESMAIYFSKDDVMKPLVAHRDMGRDGMYLAILMPVKY